MVIKTLLWLDDFRDPNEDDWLNFSPIEYPYKVAWVKNYKEFCDWIDKNGLPDGICFDHDLSDMQAFFNSYPDQLESALDMTDVEPENHGKFKEKWELEKTGMDCVKWLIDYCINNEKTLPKYNIQSANPVGKDNMNAYLNNFRAYQNK